MISAINLEKKKIFIQDDEKKLLLIFFYTLHEPAVSDYFRYVLDFAASARSFQVPEAATGYPFISRDEKDTT